MLSMLCLPVPLLIAMVLYIQKLMSAWNGNPCMALAYYKMGEKVGLVS